MDNFNIQKFFKDQYLTEAEAIPTEPGIPGERASNSKKKNGNEKCSRYT